MAETVTITVHAVDGATQDQVQCREGMVLWGPASENTVSHGFTSDTMTVIPSDTMTKGPPSETIVALPSDTVVMPTSQEPSWDILQAQAYPETGPETGLATQELFNFDDFLEGLGEVTTARIL